MVVVRDAGGKAEASGENRTFDHGDELGPTRTDPAFLRRVHALKQRFRFSRWHQPHDLPEWRKQVAQAWADCAGLADTADKPAEDDHDIDISTEGTRLPSTTEDVDQLIHQALVEEGFFVEGSEQDPPAPRQVSRRHRSKSPARYPVDNSMLPVLQDSSSQIEKGSPHANEISTRVDASTASGGAARGRPRLSARQEGRGRGKKRRVGSDAEADEHAGKVARPMPQLADVREARAKRTQSRTSMLVANDGALADDAARLASHGMGQHFVAYPSIANDEPHKWWRDKLLAAGWEDHAHVFVNDATEIILTVAVCNASGAKEQEYDILASQSLCDLRDAFYFASDWMYDGPTRLNSACFFIDGVFYTDKRDPSALDYSVEIIDWLKMTRPGMLRAHESKSMDVRFIDLGRIPFGEKCIYLHQGDIEHGVIFTNARLMQTQHDCPHREAYPVLTFMRRFHKRRCYACLENLAIWVVIDSARCPYNPSFWCQNCFRHFFQHASGEYIQPFDYKVFPYLHDDL